MKPTLVLTFFAIAIVGGVWAACKRPTQLPPGGRWVPNEGCKSGPNYDTLTPPRERCHCWGHCGYYL
ncbi:hypothetical protein Ocin01_19419 [Orchesella cincta]|uniref:Uncharacterized protein n=1 Tax=Orchesella cincta TaxID=48709 RepID=A0A1D2M2U4_ORCCI|nr:hypothetical protein Ocin01_19419 [Orchesella cincta]